MFKKMILSAAALGLLVSSTSAFALFDAELQYGNRWYSQKVDDKTHGKAMDGITVAGHLGVIPFIGLGLSASQFNVKDRDLRGYKTSSLTEVGLDVLINPPIPLIYGRVNFPVMSTLESKGSSGGTDFPDKIEMAGLGDMILSVGAEYSIIPLIGLTLEARHGVVMLKAKESKSGGVKDTDLGGDRAATLQSVMLGVKVGL